MINEYLYELISIIILLTSLVIYFLIVRFKQEAQNSIDFPEKGNLKQIIPIKTRTHKSDINSNTSTNDTPVPFILNDSKKENFSELNLHKKGVHILYYILYIVLFFMAVSGLVIHFYDFLGLNKEIAHNLKEVHELTYNFILFFVPIHILGVIIADNTSEKGLISTMINGKEVK